MTGIKEETLKDFLDKSISFKIFDTKIDLTISCGLTKRAVGETRDTLFNV
ncbi:MAG: hypothetical protein RRY18_00470 [Clostridia bacterium]